MKASYCHVEPVETSHSILLQSKSMKGKRAKQEGGIIGDPSATLRMTDGGRYVRAASQAALLLLVFPS